MTKDPELRTVNNGSLCKFSIANNRSYTAGSGERRDEVSYFNCVAWGKQAEIIHQYCRKGKQVAIEGRLKQNTWQDQEGKKQSSVDIVVESLQMLGSKDDSQGSYGQNQGSYATPVKNEPMPGGYTPDFPEPADDDDIPF